MRLFCAAALTVTVGLYVGFASPAEDDPRVARLAHIKKRYTEESEELRDRARNATDPAEVRGIRVEEKELAVITADKLLELAADDPKDAVAFEALEFMLQSLPAAAGGPGVEKAFAIISEHHLGNPKVKMLLAAAAKFRQPGQKFLQDVAAKATDKEVKGLALFYLGTAVAADLARAPDNKAEELIAQATEYFKQAAKEAPDAMVGKVKLAKAAEDEIADMTTKTLAVGTLAPDVEGTDLDGKKVKLSGYKGKVVLLDFWATWCPPCRAMIPHERDLVKKMDKRPFVLLGVSCDEKKEDLTAFLEKEPMPWAHWWDGEGGKVFERYRIRPIPSLFLIDAKGVIRKKWVGLQEAEVIDKAVEELVKEAETKG
jgi:peroxiredoxin